MTASAVPSPSTAARAWTYATVAALGGGLLLGVLTNLAQGRLPGAWNQIANSGAVWSVVAFAAGALTAGRGSLPVAAVAGLCAEIGLVAGYYGYAEVGRDGMGDLFAPLVWLGTACVAGPLFGVAGAWWRRGRTRPRRVAGPAAVAGVFGMEGAHYAFVLHYAPQAWACLAALVLMPLLMARTHGERVPALLTAGLFALVAFVVVDLGILGVLLG